MKKILLLGAGRSASSLVNYLCHTATAEGWRLRIGDISVDHLQPLLTAVTCLDVVVFDVHNAVQHPHIIELLAAAKQPQREQDADGSAVAGQAALFALSAQYPNKKIKLLAVTARRRSEKEFVPAMPCGACRQVMAEYEYKQQEAIPVLLLAPNGQFYRFRKVADLLPFQFTKDHL